MKSLWARATQRYPQQCKSNFGKSIFAQKSIFQPVNNSENLPRERRSYYICLSEIEEEIVVWTGCNELTSFEDISICNISFNTRQNTKTNMRAL